MNPGTSQPKSADLNSTIIEVQKIFETVLGSSVTLESRLDPKLGPVRGERGKIQAMLVNLFVQAREAGPLQDQLVVTTSNVELDSISATETHLVAGRYAQMEFAVERALELASIRPAIAQLQGTIQVKSAAGKFVVRVLLPRVEENSIPRSATRSL